MSYSNYLVRAVSLLVFASAALTAQIAPNRDPAPLKNWPTPLYWHPTPQEADANPSRPLPKLQFPGAISNDALTFVAMTPCRVVDTRTGQGFSSPFGPPSLAGGTDRTFPITSSTTCSIPSIAEAYSFNLSVVPGNSVGFITAFPTGQAQPLAATLVWQPNVVVSNAAIVAAGTSGSVDIYANQTTDLVVDINGYFAPPTSPVADPNTCVGAGCLAMLTTGDTNVAAGDHAGFNDTSGSSNTFLGDHTGFSNKAGSNNTFTGQDAGYMNVTNSGNTFTGDSAGYNNTADANSFFGYKAGYSNTTGFQNTFIGFQAGMNNTTATPNTTFGQSNTFVGYDSGMSSMTSQGNTFVGNTSGKLSGGVNPNDCCNTYIGNNSGANAAGTATVATTNNTFVGYRTGEATTSGTDNTYIGTKVGLVNNGFGNTFLGSAVGSSILTGNSNTFLGLLAGNSIVNGISNIEIGHVGGAAAENNTIRIGSFLPPAVPTSLQGWENQIFIEPILANQTNLTSGVTIDSTGKLGYNPSISSTSGGNVSTPSPNCLSVSPINYLTKWTGATTVDCSHIWENPTTPYNVGMGGDTAPTRQLQVKGDIDINVTGTNHYQILENTVLSDDGINNLFVGVNAGPNSFGPNPIPPGEYNTFSGYNAGNAALGPTSYNTFLGADAGQVYNATSGATCQPNCGFNTSVGALASRLQMTGENNVFLGYLAGSSFASGSNNTFLGPETGGNNTGGGSNIYIGQGAGPSGIPGPENNTIRIGGVNNGPQTATYIAGIYSATIGGSTSNPNYVVCVDSTGKLGTVGGTGCNNTPSSRRFKEQIADMGDSSSKLLQLRPVTFFYKPQYDDGSHALQYGLIAEEVAKLYPEMVGYDQDGQPSSVKYQSLAPMLLNEVQKQNAQLQSQAQAIQAQQEQSQRLEDRIAALEALLSAKASTAASGQ